MKILLKTAVVLLGTFGWWGFVYPELSLTQGLYQEQETEPEEETDQAKKGEPEKEKALKAEICGTEQIRIKSRLAEYVCEVRKKEISEIYVHAPRLAYGKKAYADGGVYDR